MLRIVDPPALSRQRKLPVIITLAFRNLFHDRVRLVATVVGIVFSIVLVTVQLGVYVSFERMITMMIDHAQADLWIAPPETKSFEESSLLGGRERFQALSVSGVTDVIPVIVGYSSWRKPNGAISTPVFIVGVQPGSAGLQPWNVIAGDIGDLATPDAVGIDRSYFERLGIEAVGDYAKIGDQKARVAVVTQGIRSFTTTPHVFTSLDRARNYIGASPGKATFFIVRIAPNANFETVRKQLTANLSDAEVLTSAEFRSRSRYFWLFDTGAGAGLLGSALLAIIVGTIIIAQTLYSNTKDHLNEFATLRAMGSSRAYILKVILCQALLSAVIGFAIAASIGFALVQATHNAALPIVMTPELTVALFALTIGMCAVSAISAIRVVTCIDPATVFTR